MVVNPEPTTHQWTEESKNSTAFEDWVSETSGRLRFVASLSLITGVLAFVMAIGILLFEDNFVARIVSKFPNNSEEEGDAIIEIGQIQTLNEEKKEGEEEKEERGEKEDGVNKDES